MQTSEERRSIVRGVDRATATVNAGGPVVASESKPKPHNGKQGSEQRRNRPQLVNWVSDSIGN